MQQEKLETINVLDVKEKELAEAQPFSFTITLDVQPSFDLPTYKGLAVEGDRLWPLWTRTWMTCCRTSANRTRAMKKCRIAPWPRAIWPRLIMPASLDGVALETVAAKAKGMGEGKDFWLMADEQNEFLPGFAAGLLGRPRG
jgi:hypothetical protein